MEQNWARLGAAVAAARRPRLTQQQLAEKVGVSRGTVQNIEHGKGLTKITPTLRAVEREIGWAPGSLERVMAGEEPVPLEEPAPPKVPSAEVAGPPPPSAVASGLPARVRQQLVRGDLIDTTVVDLGDDTTMVIVVRGKPNASPEELQRSLLAWEEARSRSGGLRPKVDDADADQPEGGL